MWVRSPRASQETLLSWWFWEVFRLQTLIFVLFFVVWFYCFCCCCWWCLDDSQVAVPCPPARLCHTLHSRSHHFEAEFFGLQCVLVGQVNIQRCFPFTRPTKTWRCFYRCCKKDIEGRFGKSRHMDIPKLPVNQAAACKQNLTPAQAWSRGGRQQAACASPSSSSANSLLSSREGAIGHQITSKPTNSGSKRRPQRGPQVLWTSFIFCHFWPTAKSRLLNCADLEPENIRRWT